MDVKYYLVTLCDSRDSLQRTPEFTNHLVVGLDPVEWFLVTKKHALYALVNFWEITETTFEGFSHEDQNAAWDTFHEFGPDDVED